MTVDQEKTRGRQNGASSTIMGVGATLAERISISICAALLFVVMVVGAADMISGELFGAFLPFKVDMSGTPRCRSNFSCVAFGSTPPRSY